ncbi:hypothetical protein FNV43_RR22926 [Rhamnella rubrinervis]|uniref:Uncharacterized protein n=1 Tax=Rhamnella rubrinervis TaxID=2594499 RepID=A0A8K0GRK6_9ROSA|nr:hypothetical protein FNV43_RR22926 [Rhamnella rubrinervis]
MGIRLMGVAHAKVQKLHKTLSARSSSSSSTSRHDVPKGHFAVYVGDDGTCKKRFVVPITYLNHPLFLNLLNLAEEEYGFDHPMGVLTIPCTQDYFLTLTSSLSCS